MPVAYVESDGRICPMILCDICGEQITAGKPSGWVLWRPSEREGLLFVHHGECDRRAEALRAKAERTGRFYSWMLDEFMDELIHNFRTGPWPNEGVWTSTSHPPPLSLAPPHLAHTAPEVK